MDQIYNGEELTPEPDEKEASTSDPRDVPPTEYISDAEHSEAFMKALAAAQAVSLIP